MPQEKPSSKAAAWRNPSQINRGPNPLSFPFLSIRSFPWPLAGK